MTLKPLIVRLPPCRKEDFKVLAIRHGVGVQNLLEAMIDTFLQGDEKANKKIFERALAFKKGC
jgi:hypothetical protein